MSELERTLVGNSAAAPPAHILEGVGEGSGGDLAFRKVPGAPRTIYEELWHIAFWLRVSLDWIGGVESAYPEHSLMSFPTEAEIERKSWDALCQRFVGDLEAAAAVTRDAARLEIVIRCPSPVGAPVRVMTVREQLESLAAHNAYHFGRIVLLRQMLGAWPPASGGDSW